MPAGGDTGFIVSRAVEDLLECAAGVAKNVPRAHQGPTQSTSSTSAAELSCELQRWESVGSCSQKRTSNAGKPSAALLGVCEFVKVCSFAPFRVQGAASRRWTAGYVTDVGCHMNVFEKHA